MQPSSTNETLLLFRISFLNVCNIFADLTSGDNSSVGANCDPSRKENITSEDRVVETKGDEEGKAADYVIYQLIFFTL